MNSGDTDAISNILRSFGDSKTAGKWFAQLNTKNDGSSIITDGITEIFQSAFNGIIEEAIKSALEKGAEKVTLTSLFSSGLSSLSGLAGKIGAAGSGLLATLAANLPLLLTIGGVAAGVGGFHLLNDKFTLTKGMADKHYEESTQKYSDNQSELESLQSERDTNQQRIYELRAKENRSTDEQAELSQLSQENDLLDAQVSIKKKAVDVSQMQAAKDAQKTLEKKYSQKNYNRQPYDTQGNTSINDMDEASEMIDYLNELKSDYNKRVKKIADEGREPSWIEQKGLDSTQKKIDDLESDISDRVSEISDTANSMKDENGELLDSKFKDTVDSANAVVQKWLDSSGSTSTTSDKMNNIFALSKFSDLKDKLVDAGKSGGTDAVKKMIEDTKGLDKAMDNAGLTADDLADSIMAIAQPDAKNLEGIKENLQDMFGKKYKFFDDKTDEDIEGFWDYLQTNNLNPEQMNWSKKDLKDNFEAYQEANKTVEAESATFSSNFKNAAASTETDIDTVTDNFQSDMSNIKTAIDSVTNGTFQNSDITDLIQQFPELSDATGSIKDNLQDLAMDKGAEAIGKIRDSVKDVTDPKELAKADKYVQSIMDTMDMSNFDIDESKAKDLVTKNIKENALGSLDKAAASKKAAELTAKYAGDEDALKAIVQLSMDPSIADASIAEWESKIKDQEVQIKINADTKDLDNLSKEMTRLQTDASNAQTDMSNKAAFNQKVNEDDYKSLIKNGDAQIKNYEDQISHYKNLQSILKSNNINAENTEQWKQYQDNIDAAQQSIENMHASQAEWTATMQNLPITNMTNLSSAITTAMSEMQTDTGLTTDSVKNLATQFSDLGDINIDNLYTRTANGLKLDTDRLQNYMEQQNQFMNSDFENKIKAQKDAVEKAQDAYKNGDMSLADYTAEQNALDELLNRRNQYFAQYQEAQEQFSDFQELQNAQNAKNAGDEYDTVKGYLNNAKELYDQNLVGTEQFKKAAKYFSQNGFDDPENFIENYNHVKDYFTDDSSGVEKFLNDMNSKGLATYETLENGQKSWTMDFLDTQNAADQMGMSLESFQAVLGKLQDYGFTSTLISSAEEGKAKVEDLSDELVKEQKKYAELKAQGASDQAISDQEAVVEKIKSQMEGTNQAIDDFNNNAASKSVDSMKQGKEVIDSLRKEMQQAEKEGNDELVKNYQKAIQDTADEHHLKIDTEFNIDEDDFNKKISQQEYKARKENVDKYKGIQDKLHNGETEWADSDDYYAADAITKIENAQSENADEFNNLVSNMKKYNLSDLESLVFGNGSYESEDQGLRDMEDQIQGFADKIGLTSEQANMLIPIFEAMGQLDITPKIQDEELEKAKTTAQEAEQSLEEITGKTYNLDFDTTNLDTIQKQVKELEDDINSNYLKKDSDGNVITDKDGRPTYDYSVEGAKETADLYDTSIKQYQAAEYQNSAIGQSTSDNELIQAAQTYMQAKNEMDVETQKYNLGMENDLETATKAANDAMDTYVKVAKEKGNPLETNLENPQKLEDDLLGTTDKDIEVKVGADTTDAQNDIQNLQNLDGSSVTINADVSTNGGVEELQSSLASIPQGVSTTVNCDVEGESDVENLETSMESIPDNTPVTIECNVKDQAQLDELEKKASSLNASGKQIKINATVGEVKTDGAVSNSTVNVKGNITEVTGKPSGSVDVKGNVTQVTGSPSGSVNVKGNITDVTGSPATPVNVIGNIVYTTNNLGAPVTVDATANYKLGEHPEKAPDISGKANFDLGLHPTEAPDIWGTAHYTGDFPTSAPQIEGTVVYHAQIQGAPANSAIPVASGTMISPAHASGTAYNVLNMKKLSSAHANGTNVALKHDERALVNEVGTESIVRDGVWSMLPGGAHLENLKQGDIVFSASQTKDLLEHGRTAGHARAYANGTLANAYAASSRTGGMSGTIGGARTRTTASSSSSNSNSNNNSANTALQTIADNTGSTADSSKETAENTSGWEDPWKNVKDWFERYTNRVDNKLDLNNSISENYQGNKNAKRNPFSIDFQNSKLNDSITTIHSALPDYQKQRDYYAGQAEAYADQIGLSQDLRDKVKNGRIQDLQILDEDTKSKVEAYQSWYDKVNDVSSSIEDLKSKEADLWNQKLSNITDRYDALKSIYSGNNDIISARVDYRTESGQSQSYNSSYARDVIAQRNNQSKLNSLTSQEIKKYQTELEDLGKQYGKQSTIYKQAAVNLKDLKKELQEGKTTVAEFNNKLKEIKLDDLQAVIDRYDRASDKQSSYRDWKDATHYKGTTGVTRTDLEEGIKTNDNSIKALYAKRAETQRQMLSLSPNSEKYRTKAKELAELDTSIQSTAKNTAELRKQIAELRLDQYDKVIDKFDRITDDCKNIQDMMDSDTFMSDDGSLTTNGLTNIALENQSMQTNQRKIATWKQELSELQDMYNNHHMTEEDFLSQSEKITSNINQAAKDVYSSQQNLIETYINQIEKENEYLQDNISKRKEALEAKKDYYDYDKTIKSKTKDINALKAQIAALEGTTNQVAKAKLEQLKADLADKEDDLKDTKYDHEVDMKSKGYENLANQSSDAVESATKAVKTNTDMQKSIISNMLKEVQDNYKDVYSNITTIVKDSGAQISAEFNNILKNIGNRKGNFNITVTSDAKPGISKSNNYKKKASGGTGRENGTVDNQVKKTNKDGSSAKNASDDDGTGVQLLKQVTANPKSVSMGVGGTASVKIGFSPSNATHKTFTCEMSNKGVVSIKKGKSSIIVHGLKVGTTIITINGYGAGCKSAKVTVKVIKDGKIHTTLAKNMAQSMGMSLNTNDITKIVNSTADKSDSTTKKTIQTYLNNKRKNSITQWYKALPAFKGDATKVTGIITQHLAQKGKKASVSDIQKAASILGYKDYKNVAKWSSSQKNAFVKKLKGYGFDRGGIIKNLIPADINTLLGNAIMKNGDTGLITAREGETVLTEKFTNMLKPTINAMNAFTDMYRKLSSPNVNNNATQQQNVYSPEYNINITGMDLSKTTEIRKAIRNELVSHDKQLAKEMKKFS